MKKNILIFGHSYRPPFVDINNHYTKLFDAEHYEVTVAYLIGEENQAIRDKHLATNVIFLNRSKKQLRGLKISTIRTLLKLHQEKNFHTVICHRYKPTYLMLWVTQFKKFPNLISVFHQFNTLNTFSRKITLALLAPKQLLLAGVSNALRDNLRATVWGIPKERVTTLYNAIDTTRSYLSRDDARKKLNLAEKEFVFGNIGRLVANKDQRSLIEAFAKIKPYCPNAKLVIVGEGPLNQELQQFSFSLGLTNEIIFTGFIENAFQVMKAFDVFISSSIQESFGLALLEAMLAKIPVIATRTQGIPEVVGSQGVLTQPKCPETLAIEMQKAYQLQVDSLQQWGQLGFEQAMNHFSFACFERQFWQLPLVE